MTLDTGIQGKDYLRQRLDPRLNDADYLHLADLRAALENFRSDEKIFILDYGCGGSPYRSLFPNAEYRRADFGEIGNLDYVIGNDGKLDEVDAMFDLILSTQVAEHVSDPRTYFAECFRLLKAGGQLICTTHGTYPDHGCPYDFQRWTANGLARDLEIAGFEVVQSLKLTTNARAWMYLIQRFSGWFESPAGLTAAMFRVMRSMMHRSPKLWQRLADKAFSHNCVVDSRDTGHEFYLGLMLQARKK
jgi:SAM-dependent methyltransferase